MNLINLRKEIEKVEKTLKDNKGKFFSSKSADIWSSSAAKKLQILCSLAMMEMLDTSNYFLVDIYDLIESIQKKQISQKRKEKA